MLLYGITLKNFLSFGEAANPLQLRPLNILIGVNSSGKSDSPASTELLRNSPEHLLKTIREGGDVMNW
jgi:predicted ATPase